MESNPSTLSSPGSNSHRFAAPARLALGIAVLAALYCFGYLDLKALAPLGHAPWTIAAVSGLTLVTLPIATWRWAIVLRALSLEVPLSPLLRSVCISTFVSQVSFGPLSADAVRGIYVWRVLRHAPGRIAVSVLVDRALGLISLLAVTALMMMLRWERVRDVPELRLLAQSLLVSLAGTVIVGAILFAAPSLVPFKFPGLQRFRGLKRRLAQIRDVLLAFRKSPLALVASLCLSFMIHALTIVGFLFIARSLQIGDVTLLDVAVAAPLAMVANILPFTPGGLGIGETAFALICRWLAPSTISAPYAGIFFAFRAVSMVMLIPGAVAFATHRHSVARDDILPLSEELARRGTGIE